MLPNVAAVASATPPKLSNAALNVAVFSLIRACISACCCINSMFACMPACPLSAIAIATRLACVPKNSSATMLAFSSPSFSLMILSFSISPIIASKPLNLPFLSKNSNDTPASFIYILASFFMPFLACSMAFGPCASWVSIMEKFVPNWLPSKPICAPAPSIANSFL